MAFTILQILSLKPIIKPKFLYKFLKKIWINSIYFIANIYYFLI